MLNDFRHLVSARRGHFQLESGYHASLWLDLDTLFAQPRRIAPLAAALGESIRPYSVDAVCGPLVGGAFLAQLVAGALDVEFCFAERVAPPAADPGLYQVRYVLPAGVASAVRGKRVAVVDDVLSAGSALYGTCVELESHGAIVAVGGALVALGDVGLSLFARHGIPVESVARDGFDSWRPDACPLCREGIPLEVATDSGRAV